MRETLGPSQTLKAKGQNLGEAAHIKGASPGGARYDASQTEEERHSAENGLWLCEFCASLVDKNNGADFSVAELSVWKLASEKAALERLLRRSNDVRDNAVDTIIFANVPRLAHYVAQKQAGKTIPLDFAEGVPDEYIFPELQALQAAIARLEFPALDWREAVELVDDPVGMLVRFEGYFWTRNGPRGLGDRGPRDFSDLSKAPHVYAKEGGLKLILPYDPKFVTTTTATVEFTSGRTRLGGFGIIKKSVQGEVVATPLFIGLASTPEGRALWKAMSAR